VDRAETEIICTGEFYDFDNQQLSEAGTYVATSTNAAGCEITTTLELQVVESVDRAETAMICTGESYEFDNQQLSEAGTYIATSTNAAGCEITTTLELQIVESVDRAETAMICTGETYNFDNQQLIEAGTYVATSTNAAGCEITMTLELQVVESVDRAETAMICTGETYNFDNQQLSEAGTYVATSMNAAGCEITTTLELQVVESLERNLNEVICTGDAYIFGNQVLTESGTYTMTNDNAAGCTTTTTLELRVNESLAVTYISEPACEIEENGSLQIESVTGGIAPYEFLLNNNEPTTPLTFENLKDGTYELRAMDATGCAITLPIVISPLSGIPELTTQFLSICPAVGIQLSAPEDLPSTVEYEWSTGSKSKSIFISRPGVFELMVSNECGSKTQEFILTDENIQAEKLIYCPNAFSPNGDNNNDNWQVFTELELQNYRLLIFNRWGSIIFETTDPQAIWDGRSKGQLLNTSTFAYFLQAEVENCDGELDEVLLKGWLELMQ
ncbi:MAG: gliding motility-associated C-terminal domain-containing protein, partial [Saprospiraceae bacterium]